MNYLGVKLKKDWDYPQDYEPETKIGVFQEREELDRLKNVILTRDKSCILVCGHRGVGKTILVYKALHDIGQKYNVVPIIISVSQLEINEAFKNGKVNPLLVLENIIRQFYVWVKNKRRKYKWRKVLKTVFKLSKDSIIFRLKYIWYEHKIGRFFRKISNIYRKALAFEWNRLENEEKLRKISLNWKIFFIPTPFILSLIISFFIDLSKVWILLINGLGVIVAFGITMLFYWKKSTREIYFYDKSIGTLEHDFREIFRDQEYFKFVFVVDELDFLNIDNTGNEKPEEEIKKKTLPFIKVFKNLFHFIPAVFIFIGDHDLYNMMRINAGGVYSTLFTDIFYLSYPKPNNLYNFLGEIKDEIIHGDKKQWEEVKYYLMYKGEGDFTKTIRTVRDYTSAQNPLLLEVFEEEFRDKEFAQSKVFRLMCGICDKSLSLKPSEWQQNDLLIKGLYHIIDSEFWETGKEFEWENNNFIKRYQEMFIKELKVREMLKEEKRDDGKLKLQWTNNRGENLPALPGELLPHEKTVKKLFDELKNKREDICKKLSCEIAWLQNKIGIPLNTKLSEIEDIINTRITPTPINLANRDPWALEEAKEHENTLENLTNQFNTWITERIIKFSDYDWYINTGKPTIDDNKNLILNILPGKRIDSSRDTNSFLVYRKEIMLNGEIICEVAIEQNALFNIIIGFNENEQNQQKYWLARLDTRPNEPEGIFFKDYGQQDWGKPTKTPSKTKNNKSYKIRVVFNESGIKLYREGRKTPIDSISEGIERGYIGFFNELGIITVKKIRVRNLNKV